MWLHHFTIGLELVVSLSARVAEMPNQLVRFDSVQCTSTGLCLSAGERRIPVSRVYRRIMIRFLTSASLIENFYITWWKLNFLVNGDQRNNKETFADWVCLVLRNSFVPLYCVKSISRIVCVRSNLFVPLFFSSVYFVSFEAAWIRVRVKNYIGKFKCFLRPYVNRIVRLLSFNNKVFNKFNFY